MGEFFHGWRRKVGIVTLVIACVFMAGWVRSATVEVGPITPEKQTALVIRLKCEWGDNSHLSENTLTHYK